VTGVIAVIAVIAGIVSSCPVRAACTVAKGARAVSPVTTVSAGRLRLDLRAGRDRRDSSCSSRSHDGHGPTVSTVTAGHGPTVGAATAVTVAGAAPQGAP
jgi:hypothetical protein